LLSILEKKKSVVKKARFKEKNSSGRVLPIHFFQETVFAPVAWQQSEKKGRSSPTAAICRYILEESSLPQLSSS
jgi:hypothetical protein